MIVTILAFLYLLAGAFCLGFHAYFNWWHVEHLYRTNVFRLIVVALIGTTMNLLFWPVFVWGVIRGR